MPATPCPPVERLRDLLAGGLEPADALALDAHVSACPACEARLAGIVPDGAGFLLFQSQLQTRTASDAESMFLHELPDAHPSGTPRGRLGRYRIDGVLGRGGMGVVFKAFDERLHRHVALKVMHRRARNSQSAKERFLLEARAAAALRSDFIVATFDADEIDGFPWIAFELLEGSGLDSLMHPGVPWPTDRATTLVRQTAEGLAVAHKAGLIHRDIKPGNLWVEAPTGRVKILDFGLVREDRDGAHITESGATVGTPAFMSPEQARGEKVDPRTDLFSLGVVLYRLLTGRPPFPGDSPIAVLMSLGNVEPTPIRQINPAVPEALADLAHRLLAKRPDDRPGTAAGILAELRRFESPTPAPASQPTPVELTVHSPRTSRGRFVAPLLALTTVAVVVGLSIWKGTQVPTDSVIQTPVSVPPALGVAESDPVPLDALPLLAADKRKPWYPADLVAVVSSPDGYTGQPQPGGMHPIFTPDGKFLVTRSGAVLDAETLELQTSGHPSVAKGRVPVAFHPVEGWAVYANGEVRDWKASGKLVATWAPVAEMQAADIWISFSPDGKWLYAGAGKNGLLCELVAPGEAVSRARWFENVTHGFAAGAFSPDSKKFASVRDDGRTVLVLPLKPGGPGEPLDLSPKENCHHAAFDDEQHLLLSFHRVRRRELWDLDGAKPVLMDTEEGYSSLPLDHVYPLAGGRGFVVAGWGLFGLLRTKDGKIEMESKTLFDTRLHRGCWSNMVHPDGDWVYSSGNEGIVQRFSLAAIRDPIKPLLRAPDRFVAWHPADQPMLVSGNGRFLFVKSARDRMHAWEIPTGRTFDFTGIEGAPRVAVVSDVAMRTVGAESLLIRQNDWTPAVITPGDPDWKIDRRRPPKGILPLATSEDLTTVFGIRELGHTHWVRRPHDGPEGVDLPGIGEFNEVVRLSADAKRCVAVPVPFPRDAGVYEPRDFDLSTDPPTATGFDLPPLRCAAIRPDLEVIACGRSDTGNVEFYDRKSAKALPVVISPLEVTPGGKLAWVDYSADGKRLLTTATTDGSATVALWDAGTGERLGKWVVRHGIHAKFSPEGRHVLVSSAPGAIWILRIPKE